MGADMQMAGFRRPLGANDTIKELCAIWSAAMRITRSAPKFRTLSQTEQEIEDKEWLAAKTGVHELAYWAYDLGIHATIVYRFLGGRYEQERIEITIPMLDVIVDDCINDTAVKRKGPLWGPYLEDEMLEYIAPLERVRKFLLTPGENEVRRVLYWNS